jgi:isopentenyl-diphosphate delta-isomerase
VAKTFCLGADLSAAAQPIIKAVVEDGFEGLQSLYKLWHKELTTILALLGCERIKELDRKHLKLNRLQR